MEPETGLWRGGSPGTAKGLDPPGFPLQLSVESRVPEILPMGKLDVDKKNRENPGFISEPG